jgi:acetolactate synthase, small subunit (EC 2.2.1.6)
LFTQKTLPVSWIRLLPCLLADR